MESYIVRIYRRDEKDAAKIIGLVEAIETSAVERFQDKDELSAILCRNSGTAKSRMELIQARGCSGSRCPKSGKSCA